MKLRHSIAITFGVLTVAGCGENVVTTSQAKPNRAELSSGRSLSVPHLKQEHLQCVPTAAAMVTAFYGDKQSPRRLKALSRGTDYNNGASFDDYTITMFVDLLRGLRTIGYRWEERTLPNTQNGWQVGLRLIELELAKGHPVIVDVSIPEGHTFVVSGIDAENRTITVTDPNQPSPGRVLLTFEQFEPIWHEGAYGGDFRALILTSPKTGDI